MVSLSFWYYDYTIQLANSVVRHVDELMLLLPSCTPKEYLDGIKNGDLELYCFTHPKRYIHRKLPISIKEILKKIRDFNPDLIHIQASNPLICLLLPLIRRRFPIVTELHDLRPHIGEKSFLYEVVLSFSRRCSDRIIVHGQRLKEELVRVFGVNENKISSIVLGEHEVKPFLKYCEKDIQIQEDDNNTILFFGRIVKYKGLRYLVKAESIITKDVPDAKIIIAGEGNLKKAIGENLIKLLERRSFIVINRFIPYSEGAKLFSICNVVVLPYIEGSQSGVIHPAYAFKKPVVVTNVGSFPEIVDDCITGFVVPPRDPKGLAERITLLLENEKLRKKMGENAYKKLKTDLSWDKISKEIVKIYEWTLR